MTRVAVIGCGRHMQGTLSKYLRRLEDIQVTACVDINHDAALVVGQTLKASQILTSVEEVDWSAIDIALLATPPKTTYEISNYLIGLAIPLFVEKPPASTSDQILDLLSLANFHEVYVQVGFNFRYANAVNAIVSDKSKHTQGGSNIAYASFLSKHPQIGEGGISNPVEAWLRHNGVHLLDMMSFLLGKMISVRAILHTHVNGRFLVAVHSLHTDQSVSFLKLGNMTDRFQISIHLHTQDDHQYLMPNLSEVRLTSPERHLADGLIYQVRNLDDGWGIGGYGGELDYFLKNFANHSQASPSLADALVASKVCDAILESIQRNIEIEIR